MSTIGIDGNPYCDKHFDRFLQYREILRGGKERRTWRVRIRERIPTWLVLTVLAFHTVWIALDMHYKYYYSMLWRHDLIVLGFVPILLLDLFLIYLTIDKGEEKSE